MTTHNMGDRIPYCDAKTSDEYLDQDHVRDSILDDALIGVARAQSLKELWEAETPALLRKQAV